MEIEDLDHMATPGAEGLRKQSASSSTKDAQKIASDQIKASNSTTDDTKISRSLTKNETASESSQEYSLVVKAANESEVTGEQSGISRPESVQIDTSNAKNSKDSSALHSCPSHLRSLTKVERMVESFHNIVFTVGGPASQKNKIPFCKPKPFKRIISDVSGIMKPGVNALMGPTGSGKSSLLDILAGRKDTRGLKGEVLINGNPMPPNFKRNSGYVIQEDVVLGTLTVRENLWFSASMRLPTSVPLEMKKQRVNEVIYDLGLTACADTKVGTDLIRGISGGEKKRACIGMELITAPTVLFLDEPTTGLDASTANAVMLLLKKLGNRGRTIILSIHQPRYSIFRLFDTLTLLCKGRLTYHGPYDKVLPYFETLGYHCQEHNNPADFFLDVINGDSTALAHTVEDELGIENQATNIMHPDEENQAQVPTEEASADLAVQLAAKFETSSIYRETAEELSRIKSEARTETKTSRLEKYATPFSHQFCVLSKRAFRNFIRNPVASIGNVFLSVVIALVFGGLFYQIDDTPTTGIQNRFGVVFFLITNVMFGSLSAAEVFSKEKRIFIHEYVSGYYMVLPYFLAKILADLIPMRTLPPVVFGAVTYWLVGLKADANAAFTFLFFLLLVGYTATAITIFYSATFDAFAVASIFITLTFIFSILFAGLLLNVDTVVAWLSWIKYMSPAHYGYSALCLNEFRNMNFTSCSNNTGRACLLVDGAIVTRVGNMSCCTQAGERAIYDSLGLGNGELVTDWDLWKNAIALTCIMSVMLSLTYLQLVRTKTAT